MLRKLKIMLLKSNLRNGFWIGGYKDCMVRAGHKYLDAWQVKLVHECRDAGKIIECGETSVTSTATGITYTNKIYKYVD